MVTWRGNLHSIFQLIQSVKKSIKKKLGGGAEVLICLLRHHSRTFSTLELLSAHFCNIFPPHLDLICLDNSPKTPF